MRIYESENGAVDISLFMQLTFTLPNNRRIKATKLLKAISARLSYELKSRGYNPDKNDVVKAVLWEYMLDLAHSPANSIRHQMFAQQQVDDVVQDLIATVNHNSLFL